MEIPRGIKKRIIALVSDGIRGGAWLAKEQGWRQQRCHFHLIAELQKIRGKRKRLIGRSIREKIYRIVRMLLTTNDPFKGTSLGRQLRYQIRKPDCPKRARMIVRELLRHLTAFHLYLEYPEWGLPNTTGVMESVGSSVRTGAGKINTPQALFKWATAIIRTHPKFVCKKTII